MFTSVETLFAKTELLVTFFKADLLCPENKGGNAEQLERQGSQL